MLSNLLRSSLKHLPGLLATLEARPRTYKGESWQPRQAGPTAFPTTGTACGKSSTSQWVRQS